MICSGIERTAPATMSQGNHRAGTSHRRRAAAAIRSDMPEAMPRTGVSVLSKSPVGKRVRVSMAKGREHATDPPGRGCVPGLEGNERGDVKLRTQKEQQEH